MQAVILAGGAGTRLRPLTLDTPKPMIDVNGKPLLLYVIEELKKHGIKDILLCVGYLAEKFEGFFGDGKKFGVSIKYSVEKDFFGTAGALKLAEGLLAEDFFVLNGDTYLKADYQGIYRAFKKEGKLGMMVIYDNKEKVAEANIAIDDQKSVVSYGKKEQLKKGDQLIAMPSEVGKQYQYVDAGVYVFKKGLIDLIDKGKFVSLEADIYPKLIKMKELKAYVTSQRHYDLGTPERLELIRRVMK
jgi:mannose-1-phosphate guanylyltransferase